jgi:hypothetical protein
MIFCKQQKQGVFNRKVLYAKGLGCIKKILAAWLCISLMTRFLYTKFSVYFSHKTHISMLYYFQMRHLLKQETKGCE